MGTEITDAKSLMEAVNAGQDLQYLLFWGHKAASATVGKHVLSQWWPAPFVINNNTYQTAEHYMMAEKARLFQDGELESLILAAPDPKTAKALGRRIRGFDAQRWTDHCVDIVIRGNTAKFGQHPELSAWLQNTGNAVLVEASPVDPIWGIGLSADDPRAVDPNQWRGSNLLGFALMQVRAKLSLGSACV